MKSRLQLEVTAAPRGLREPSLPVDILIALLLSDYHHHNNDSFYMLNENVILMNHLK